MRLIRPFPDYYSHPHFLSIRHNIMLHFWDNLAYEVALNGDTAVVFAKGLNLRPGRGSNPTQGLGSQIRGKDEEEEEEEEKEWLKTIMSPAICGLGSRLKKLVSNTALRARDECKWVSFMDVYEFLYFPFPNCHYMRFKKMGFPGYNSLRALTANFSKSASIGEIRTACHSFGYSGLKSPPSQGVTVRYTCRLHRPERHKLIVC
ncbi:hypothetical protein LguiA_032699 [Lonicera macranthoides]